MLNHWTSPYRGDQSLGFDDKFISYGVSSDSQKGGEIRS